MYISHKVGLGFPSYSCVTIIPVLITWYFAWSKGMVPIKFSSIFSVCNITFMICSREYYCTENEKTE